MRELLEPLSVSTLPMFAYRLDEPAQPAYDPLGAFVVRTEPATPHPLAGSGCATGCSSTDSTVGRQRRGAT